MQFTQFKLKRCFNLLATLEQPSHKRADVLLRNHSLAPLRRCIILFLYSVTFYCIVVQKVVFKALKRKLVGIYSHAALFTVIIILQITTYVDLINAHFMLFSVNTITMAA